MAALILMVSDFAGRNYRFLVFVILTFVVLGICFCLSLSSGSVDIPFTEVWKTLCGGLGVKNSWITIIYEFRLPRAITAVLAGSALSTSGLLMQAFFRNPLAGPYVLGISSGASLGVAIVIFMGAFLSQWITIPALGGMAVVIAASFGAILVFAGIYLAARRIASSSVLLIIGLMLGYATSGLVSLLIYFGDGQQVQSFFFWTFGSFGKLGWERLQLLTPIVCLGLIFAFLQAKPLNAWMLGDRYAASLGLNLSKTRKLLIIATSLLAGSITAFCGPVAFLGIAVPHLGRALLQSGDHRQLIPFTILLGSVVALIADIISQMPGSSQTLPLNAVTSLFGAPVVVWVILRQHALRGNDDQ